MRTKTILSWFGVGCIGFSLHAFAEQGDTKFNEFKQKEIEHLEQRIKDLQDSKSCLQASTHRDALKTCHKQARERQRAHREERMDHRIKRLQDRKNRLNEKTTNTE